MKKTKQIIGNNELEIKHLVKVFYANKRRVDVQQIASPHDFNQVIFYKSATAFKFFDSVTHTIKVGNETVVLSGHTKGSPLTWIGKKYENTDFVQLCCGLMRIEKDDRIIDPEKIKYIEDAMVSV